MAHLDADYVRNRFPTITQACRRAGFDLATDRIPVSPAAHYVMGGVETDLCGRTSIDNLFAAGEAACTGVHGANRLASNSLLEGLVFGARAADAMRGPTLQASLAAEAGEPFRHADAGSTVRRSPASAGQVPSASDVRDVMWRDAGLVRSRIGLAPLVERLSSWRAAVSTARIGRPGRSRTAACRQPRNGRSADRPRRDSVARKAAAGTSGRISRSATIYTGRDG